jgi:2-polyprenyl-6-methoxyphenol hydroxylase-like FAD-dependent oxidoreductase
VREAAGLGIESQDYDQQGVVTTVRSELPHARTAWQRFLPSGPFALLRVRDGFHNIVWSTTHQAAKSLEALGPEQFAEAANRVRGGPVATSHSLGE